MLLSVDELNALSPAERATVLCQACTVTAEFLQHEIADRSMQDDIIHTAESGCEDLPSDMQQEVGAMCSSAHFDVSFVVQSIGGHVRACSLPNPAAGTQSRSRLPGMHLTSLEHPMNNIPPCCQCVHNFFRLCTCVHRLQAKKKNKK
jgi:hypothetical protein